MRTMCNWCKNDKTGKCKSCNGINSGFKYKETYIPAYEIQFCLKCGQNYL
jgi:hypothetical protein